MTDDEITFMIKSGHPKLSVVSTEIVDNTAVTVFSTDTTSVGVARFYWYPSKVSGVSGITDITDYRDIYPRIKISSNELNINSIVLKYNDNLLDNYSDY